MTLDRVAAVMAVGVDPTAPPESELLGRMDALGAEWSGDRPATSADVMAHVFTTLRFAPNTTEYYSLSNSLLHRVIEVRRGNPISLSIVAIEIGRRMGVKLVPVGMPAHFLIGECRPGEDQPDRWFDPFGAGREIGEVDARRIFDAIAPVSISFSAAMLEATPTRDVAARILANISNAAIRAGDVSMFIGATEMTLGLPAAGVSEYRSLARALASTGRHDRAAEVFDWLVRHDHERTDDHAVELRRHLAHRN